MVAMPAPCTFFVFSTILNTSVEYLIYLVSFESEPARKNLSISLSPSFPRTALRFGVLTGYLSVEVPDSPPGFSEKQMEAAEAAAAAHRAPLGKYIGESTALWLLRGRPLSGFIAFAYRWFPSRLSFYLKILLAL